MIEKLDIDPTQSVATNHCIINKVNQLIDAVNAIQKEREAERFEIQEWIGILEAVRKSVNVHEKQIDELQMKLEPEKCETPADPYAEQRKWIGKLCKFWDNSDEPENCVYDILCNIFDSHHEDCPFQCGNGEWYEYCEPVKPDDDIIYKGKRDENI